MTTNLIIGIGGTGAKCVESAIHCFAAGMGPSNVTVGFVEVDKANGNLQRATKTLAQYRKACQAFTAKGTCQIDPKDDGLMATQCHVFRVDNTQNGEEDTVWSPIPKGKERLNLQELFGNLPYEQRLLFDSLFSMSTDGPLDSAEQTMLLYEGSRGRPNVGCALLAACAHENESWWSQLLAVGRKALSENEPVKVLLVGSTFGGTGASGIPAIARLLRSQLGSENQAIAENLSIGAILMLPYFWFDPSEGKADRDPRTIVAKSEQFINVSSSALKFYYDLIHAEKNEKQRTFDQVTLLGWPEQLRVPAFAVGGEPQNNPPLLPELYAGLAAANFFAMPANPQRRFYLVALEVEEDRKLLSWNDLPPLERVERAELGKPKNALGQVARFGVAFRFVYRNLLRREAWKDYEKQVWYRTLIKNATSRPDLNTDDSQERLSSLKEYLDIYLKWMGAMALPAVRGDMLMPGFLSANTFARRADKDEYGVSLKEEKEYETSVRDDFTTFVQESKPLSFSEIFSRLTYEPAPPRTEGLGVFVSRLYRACRVDTGTK